MLLSSGELLAPRSVLGVVAVVCFVHISMCGVLAVGNPFAIEQCQCRKVCAGSAPQGSVLLDLLSRLLKGLHKWGSDSFCKTFSFFF